MSYLGYANPFYHLGHIIRGYLVAPLLLPMPSDFYTIEHRLWHNADPNDTVGTPVGWRGTPLWASALPLNGGGQMLPLRLPRRDTA